VSGLQRILIRIPNWLGDALMARPLLHGLRQAHPGAEIRAVGPAPLLSLLAMERIFDAGEAWPARGDADRRAARARRNQLAAALRDWRPEAALVLPFSFSSARFALSTRAPVRIGYAHELRSPMLTHALRRPAGSARAPLVLARGQPVRLLVDGPEWHRLDKPGVPARLRRWLRTGHCPTGRPWPGRAARR
jgi:ADP-heptose:LPS heptosyltransferase